MLALLEKLNGTFESSVDDGAKIRDVDFTFDDLFTTQ